MAFLAFSPNISTSFANADGRKLIALLLRISSIIQKQESSKRAMKSKSRNIFRMIGARYGAGATREARNLGFLKSEIVVVFKNEQGVWVLSMTLEMIS
jgi:hypothetical protein